MRIAYAQDTDSLYIDFSHQPGSDAREVAPGIVLDFDATGTLVGIDIQHASKVVDLNRLDTEAFPVLSTNQSQEASGTGTD